MGVVTHGQVVVTGAQDITLRALGIVAGQHVALALDGNGLALAGFQRVGLFKADDLHGGFFDAVGFLVIAVGGLGVDFDHALACHIAGVGHFDFDLVLVGIGVEGDTFQGLGEVGVGQAVAERIHNFVSVVPAAAGGRTDGGRSISIAHHSIFITGLVVFIAYVDALGIDGVVVNVDAVVGKVRCLAVDVIHVAPQLHVLAGVGGGGGRQRVGGVGIYQMAAGRNLTSQHVGNTLVTGNTGHTGQHTGIDIIIVEPVQFHHLVGIDDNDDLFKRTGSFLGLQILHQVFFVGLQAQEMGAILGIHGGIVALAAQAGKYGDGGIVVVTGPAAGVFFNVGNGGFHNFGGAGGAQRSIGVIQQRSVDVVRAEHFLHRSAERHGRNRSHAGCGAAAHGGMCRAVAEDRHAAGAVQRQGGVFVAQQNGAFFGLGDVFSGHFHFYF